MTRPRFVHAVALTSLLIVLPTACADALNELENPATPRDASTAPAPDKDDGAGNQNPDDAGPDDLDAG